MQWIASLLITVIPWSGGSSRFIIPLTKKRWSHEFGSRITRPKMMACFPLKSSGFMERRTIIWSPSAKTQKATRCAFFKQHEFHSIVTTLPPSAVGNSILSNIGRAVLLEHVTNADTAQWRTGITKNTRTQSAPRKAKIGYTCKRSAWSHQRREAARNYGQSRVGKEHGRSWLGVRKQWLVLRRDNMYPSLPLFVLHLTQQSASEHPVRMQPRRRQPVQDEVSAGGNPMYVTWILPQLCRGGKELSNLIVTNLKARRPPLETTNLHGCTRRNRTANTTQCIIYKLHATPFIIYMVCSTSDASKSSHQHAHVSMVRPVYWVVCVLDSLHNDCCGISPPL